MINISFNLLTLYIFYNLFSNFLISYSLVVHIPGKTLPAPARQLIVEKYETLPQKPQPVIVERWLPYDIPERPIIHDCKPPEPITYKKKNIIIKYECPEVCIKQKFHHMPVECVNPCEYISKYGPTLKKSSDLPSFVKDIKTHSKIYFHNYL